MKKEIICTSTNLFMRYGIRSVTMDDIARELGISKKTLYQYIDNKTDLIEQILQRHLEGDQEAMLEIRAQSINPIDEMLRIGRYVTEQLRAVSVNVIYDLNKYYASSWRAMEQEMRAHIFKIISDNIERGISEGLYRADMDAGIIARLFVGKSMLMVDEDFFGDREYLWADLHQEFVRYHMYGIVSANGRHLLEKYLAAEQL